MSSDEGIVSARMLGRFQLMRRLAIGGMAEVFEAHDPRRGEAVVIKLLLPQLRDDAEFRQMFADEARLSTGVRHPNLVRTLEVGDRDERPFMVMELVDGCSLADLLRRRGGEPLPPAIALRIGQEILAGLQHLHCCCDEAGRPLQIVHRDVTPGNVLLSRAGEVKLSDFGIARSLLRATRTRTGVIKGTVQYMSPEQVTGSEADQRSDIYGAGLVIFELLTGEAFIRADSEVELLRRAEEPVWRAPSTVNRAVDRAFDAALRPALQRFPEQRYRSPEDFFAALQQAASTTGLPVAEPPELARLVEQLAPASEHAMPRRPQARRWPWLAALVVIGAAGSWWAARGPQQRGQTVAPPRPATTWRTDAALRQTTIGVPADGLVAATVDARAAVDTRARAARGPALDAGRPRRRPRPHGARPVARRRDAAAAGDIGTRTSAAEQLERRLTALGVMIKDKGLLGAHELPEAAKLIDETRRAMAAGDPVAAARRLQRAEQLVAGFEINQGFIRAKLQLVDRRLRELPQGRADVVALRQRAAEALQAFMDGQYTRANRLLNAIIRLLGRPT